MKTFKQIITVVALAIFMLGSFNGNAQKIDKNTKFKNLKVSRVGKLHAVITFLETKEFYSKGMSQERYIENILSKQFDNGQRPIYIKEYLSFIYKFHANGSTYDQVYDKTDGVEFSNIMNSMLKFHKKGISRSDFESSIFLNGSNSLNNKIPKPKNGWLNFVRKIIDIIDDEF